MRNPTNYEQIGGQGFHASDSNVWASIFYLDSPTDYRDYLPRDSSRHPRVPLRNWSCWTVRLFRVSLAQMIRRDG